MVILREPSGGEVNMVAVSVCDMHRCFLIIGGVSVARWAARVSVYGKEDEQIIVLVCLWLCARIQKRKVNADKTMKYYLYSIWFRVP